MKGLWLRLRRLLGWRRAEQEIDEELRFHVEMETESLVKEGYDRAEARRLALVALGGEDRWREETRAARGTGWLEDGVRDVRFAMRALVNAPGFAFAALGTIALGVGATTAIFSVVQGVVLAPLPYPEPDELVTVWMRNPAQGIEEDITSWPNFVDWREGSTTLERMASVRSARFALTGDGDPEEIVGAMVSRGFFELIGAPLALGRGFRDDEVEGDLVRVVVLSHELFARRFGADPTLVGRTIDLSDQAYEVVGIAAPGAAYPRQTELWVPQSFDGGLAGLREARGALWLPVVGRLSDGVTLTAAQTEMDALARRLEEAYPNVNEGVGIKLETFRETLVGDVRSPLLVLLAAVGLVLLIAIVNVANLLLARGAARRRELAVRLTLGADRGRVVRQVLAESLVLGGVGAVAGIVLATAGVEALVAIAPPEIPRVDEVDVDRGVLGFALALALAASVVFGAVPAFQAAHADPGVRLHEGSRGSSSAGLARLRGGFVIGQCGLALLLLVGSGLLVRSFLALRATEPGFEPQGVLSVTVALPTSRYPAPEDRRAFHDRMLEEVAGLPGVTGAGAVSNLFLSALPNMGPITIDGRPELTERTREHPVVRDMASPDFFETVGMTIVAGRAFDATDRSDAMPVAIVNESFAQTYLQGIEPLGQRFMWGSPDGEEAPPWITIVGIVRDARRSGLDRPVRPSAFLSMDQVTPARVDVLVRAGSDPLALTPAVRAAIGAIDARLPLTRVRSLEQALADELSQRRFVVWLLGVFAVSALTLAGVGIFGVMAYLVGQRTREIGIRVALGAERGAVLRGVVREGMAHAATGLIVGTIAAVALTRYVRSQLFGIEPTDPATFAAAAALLLAAAAVACAARAARAAAVDPMVALREE